MSDGVIVLDTHNRFIDLNLSAQRIIGYSLSDVIGQSLSRVLSGQPELIERSNIGVATANVEITIGKGETKRYYESSISPIYDRQGRLTGRLVILHDITERRLIEAEKKDLEEKAQLASRLSIIGEMAAGVAHEVNNPLTSVIGYADWLLQHDIPDEIRRDIEVINTQATRASEILDRLLTFAGHHVVNRDHVDINRVIETTIELRSHSLAKNNIEIIYQFAPNLPKTMADGGQLQQVFLNLIINAETSIAEANDKGMLIVKTETFDNHIRVSIIDDGLGITEENLTKIFQPFFSTRETGKGTGLGLSICHGIISKHNGRIYVESEFGYGATFIVELPIVVQ
jgi:PAS domain S-box-containing protein